MLLRVLQITIANVVIVSLENIHPRDLLNAQAVRQGNIKMLRGEPLVKSVLLVLIRPQGQQNVPLVNLVNTKVKTVNPGVLTIQLVLQTKLLLEGQKPLMLLVQSV